MNRRVREVMTMVKALGLDCEVSHTGSGHLRLRVSLPGRPGHRTVCVSRSPSCTHHSMNTRAELRRAKRTLSEGI